MRSNTYTDEFKAQAIQMAKTTSISHAAKVIGIRPQTLRYWVNTGMLKNDDPEQVSVHLDPAAANKINAQEEILRLKAEVLFLQSQVEVFKKAAAYFAQDLVR